jgi:hypothetical protein
VVEWWFNVRVTWVFPNKYSEAPRWKEAFLGTKIADVELTVAICEQRCLRKIGITNVITVA